MKVTCKVITAVIFSFAALALPFQTVAADLVGGGGNPAEKLLLDWAKYKPAGRAYPVSFSKSISSTDLVMLQNGKIDFTILDYPLSEAELARMNLFQAPIVLNGVSIVVNLPNTLAGTLRLDSQTLGKIFSGEITHWDDPAITTLNPRHELPNKTITLVHSGISSTDFSVINNYIGSINEKWKSADLNGKKKEWPDNSVQVEGFDARITSIKKTPFSLSYLPMQYIPKSSLSTVHIQNKDGKFVGLSETGINASTSTVNLEEGHSASLVLANKKGSATWPISNFTFVVISKARANEDKIVQFLNIISYGLKTGTLKTLTHNYVPIPEQQSKTVMANIEAFTSGSNTATSGKLPLPKTNQETAQEPIAEKNGSDAALAEKANRQRAEALEEKNRAAKQLIEDRAREQEIKEAKAAKLAAEEALRVAKAAKLEADALAEKNRLIAKAEKEKADREKAEKEKAEKEKIAQEKAIQMRNQKDEDPLEAYRRSIK